MSRLRVLAAVLSVFALPAPLAIAADDEILTARIEVLEELAEESVFDAYYELADLIRTYPDSTRFDRHEATRYLAMSASSGRGSAVRWLAYRLLADYDAGHEAATLISIAALMGDEKATVDLKLWPKLTRVSQQTMTSAFGAAVDRLAGGRIVDCAELPFECVEGTETVTSVAAGDVLHATRLRAQGPYADAESVHALFGPFYNDYSAYPDARFRQFRAENRERNTERRAAGDTDARPRDDAGRAERAQRDREQSRREAAGRYLDRTLDADIERYRGQLERAVERINRHRAPADHIEPDALIESIRGSNK